MTFKFNEIKGLSKLAKAMILVLMCASLCACGGSDDDDADDGGVGSSSSYVRISVKVTHPFQSK